MHPCIALVGGADRGVLIAQNMNYAIVVSFPVWAGALGYYYIDAYKWFTGPKTTIDAQSTPTEVEGYVVEQVVC